MSLSSIGYGTDRIGPERVFIQIGWSSTGQPSVWVYPASTSRSGVTRDSAAAGPIHPFGRVPK